MFYASATCLWLVLCATSVELVNGQEDGTAGCYGPGSIAASVILTIIFTALLLGALYYLWKKYRKRKEQHLILETDPEKGKGEYAFDNPGFKEVGLTPVTKSLEKQTKFESTSNSKPKWNHWPHLSAIARSEKRKTLDDSVLDGSQVKVVPLRGHDFTGLGFTVCGNMKEGIYVKDVLHRGPALESGKLSPGDRINSVTISFEHMVFEDALSILSYASPYEVIIEARSGKTIASQSPGQAAQPAHPIYRSSSAINLTPGEHGVKKRLFGEEYPGSNYSSLQKTQSNMTTLERKESKSPKPLLGMKAKKLVKTQLSPEQLKSQLEQKIQSDHQQNLKHKENQQTRVQKIEQQETQRSENKFQKFGIRVLPPTQISPKIESSQNDNNINMEKQPIIGIDEVDDRSIKPQVKRREKKSDDSHFKREDLNGSGIRRDANGIPQEIPNYMMNAAVAARSNRKNSENLNISEEIDKSTPGSKKPKGKAPPPPPNDEQNGDQGKPRINGKISPNLDEIHSASDDYYDEADSPKTPIIPDESREGEEEVELRNNKKDPVKDYNSDSDLEQDNQSSVNTIELNSSDITIHHAEENEDLQNRKTASTGDLTKIQKTRKSSTGTLERAQSLDITDTTIPTLSKKRKGGRIEDSMASDEDLFGKALVNKEPRLSLILDGLNTFQRNRLKKSTEWGNLEDAILKLDKEDEGIRFNQNAALDKFDFGEKSHEFDALVNKINEIKRESLNDSPPIKPEKKMKNQIWPTFENSVKIEESRPIPADKRQRKPSEERAIIIEDEEEKKTVTKPIVPEKKDFLLESRLISKAIYPPSLSENEDNAMLESSSSKSPKKWIEDNKSDEIKSSPQPEVIVVDRELLDLTKNFIFTERIACGDDEDYLGKVGEDTNISDDIKVSRHSLGSLERPKSDDAKLNVSNVTINSENDALPTDNVSMEVNLDETPVITDDYSTKFNDLSELYTTALDTTSVVGNRAFAGGVDYESGKVTITTPDLIKNVTITEAINTLNSEHEPRSLTLEIPGESPKIDENDANRSKNSSLTYITEIQVITPNNTTTSSGGNVSEIEIIPNLDHDFENYVKNFESNVQKFETKLENHQIDSSIKPDEIKKSLVGETLDAEKELHKIQEIAEEQLKKLPEMRFTTSSYESPSTQNGSKSIPTFSSNSQEKRQSQIELLRSNFEKTSPPKSLKGGETIKSRIPIATAKTPPTSPERRDSRNLDMENDRDILELMSASVHSTPAPKYQIKPPNSKNVTVTSIRSNSKIPSGLPILGGSSRPPIPPRKSADDGDVSNVQVQVSTNGGVESSFKQWVFNPNSNHNDHSVTNIVVTENKQK